MVPAWLSEEYDLSPSDPGFVPLQIHFGVSLGMTLQTYSLVLLKSRKDMNNVICCQDNVESSVFNAIQSIHKCF